MKEILRNEKLNIRITSSEKNSTLQLFKNFIKKNIQSAPSVV